MKKFISTSILLFLLLFLEEKNYAQCNFNDNALNVADVLTSPANCPGSGSITVNNVTGGGGIYAYEILDGPVVRIIQSQNVFNALASGEYIVRVTGCNGDIVDKTVNIGGNYSSLYVNTWQASLYKKSGLTCGITNNGVYKLDKPSYTGGRGPFRIQISSTADFTSVPYMPGNDSATFTDLNQSTTYYVRISDACNNFITFDFLTPPAAPAIPLSVPTLKFQRVPSNYECTGKATLNIFFKDSATGNSYDAATTYTNKVFWGNLSKPYIRVRIEDSLSGFLYSDKNLGVTKTATPGIFNLDKDYGLSGETGLVSPGTGIDLMLLNSYPLILSDIYSISVFPVDAPLKITIYFPGGNHCGTIVPAYSKTFYFNMGHQTIAAAHITNVASNCAGFSSYFRVDFDKTWVGDTILLIKTSPTYTVLKKISFNTGAGNSTNVDYIPLILGSTYRIVIKDACGRADSMDRVYNPAAGSVPPPPVTLDYKVNFKCPTNPNDTVYNIMLYELPAGYLITKIFIDGTQVIYSTYNNWKGTGTSVRQLTTLLPPGTYTCQVVWINACNAGTVSKSITIPPVGDAPSYTKGITLSLSSQTGTCTKDAFKSIEITGYLRNINTNYVLRNLRLISVPNPYVFPLYEKNGNRLENASDGLSAAFSTTGDSSYLFSPYSGIRVNTGQEGLYTFGFDILCPDGTVVETVTKSINITTTTSTVNYLPDLKYSNALVCASSSSQLNINMFSVGGKKPFKYEYKPEANVSFIQTGNAGADSTVIITPAPVPGTIYDIRVTDACGNTASNKVTVSTFTGEFFIYNYPPDCTNSPFNTKIGTSWIRGAYYTWERNGLVVAQGYNIPSITLSGVTVDSVTVDVNLYNCYSGAAARTVVAPNPCGMSVLPVANLTLTGNRISPFNVQLVWKTTNGQTVFEYFDLQKSTNGSDYRTVSRVMADEKPWEHSYVYTDPESAAVVYYRVKGINKETREMVTPIIKIENKKIIKPLITISPNPAHDNICLAISTDRIKPYKGRIFNDKGQLVKEFSITQEEISAKKVDLSILSSGTYFLSLIDNWEIVASAKFIKQ